MLKKGKSQYERKKAQLAKEIETNRRNKSSTFGNTQIIAMSRPSRSEKKIN